jgi:tripartite-type tricarboxylate transporter receptor subunit TctC
MTRRIFICATAIAALLAAAMPGRATDYPSRPLRLVVPYPPGGGTDLAARRLAEEMGKGLGQRIVVENIGGAGGLIGMQQVARAEPNGYTLVLALTAQFAVNASLFQNLPYDPVNDYEPIALLATAPYVLVVHPDLPVRTVKDLIEVARRQTNKLSYASAGNGSGAHLSTELLKSLAGIDMVHVPYKGAAAAHADLLAGRVPVMFSTYATIAGHLEAGKLRAIAVSTEQRAAGLKDVPAIAETLPGYRSDVWYVLAAPAGTPKDIIARLNAEALTALKSPLIAKQFADDLVQAIGSRPDEVKPFIATEIAKWGEVVKRSGAQIQ